MFSACCDRQRCPCVHLVNIRSYCDRSSERNKRVAWGINQYHEGNKPAGWWGLEIFLCWPLWPDLSLTRSPDEPHRSRWTFCLCSEETQPTLTGWEEHQVTSVSDGSRGEARNRLDYRQGWMDIFLCVWVGGCGRGGYTHQRLNWSAAEPGACGWQSQIHEAGSPCENPTWWSQTAADMNVHQNQERQEADTFLRHVYKWWL